MSGGARVRLLTGVALALLAPAFGRAAERPEFNFTRRAGLYTASRPDSVWFQVADSTLAPGDTLTLLTGPESPPSAGETQPPRLTKATIARRWGRPALSRIFRDEKRETIYLLRVPDFDSIEGMIGFGLLAPRGSFSIRDGHVESDLDRDGLIERYSECSGREGIHMEIWDGRSPHDGEPVVDFYYYAGYDLEPTCPDLGKAE